MEEEKLTIEFEREGLLSRIRALEEQLVEEQRQKSELYKRVQVLEFGLKVQRERQMGAGATPGTPCNCRLLFHFENAR